MRILGVDYGDARVVIAVCDENEILASALPPIQAVSMRKSIDAVGAVAGDLSVGLIVVGLPLNMNGSEGPQACKVKAFADNLAKATGIPVVMKDERLTTVFVERAFDETGVKKSRRKQLVDSASAQVILQNYLDGRENSL